MKIKILHVVGGMNRGGIETWLMHVLRHIDRDRFHLDFLVHTERPCAYDDEIRALGSRIIPCLSPRRPWSYARNFRRTLREYGPYDVVHSHVHHFSGYVLCLAAQAGAPTRIAHSHVDTSPMSRGYSLWRRGYVALAEHSIHRYATVCLAASEPSAQDLFGPTWRQNPACHILHYGIDLEPFRRRDEIDRRGVRAELNLPQDAFVVGHVGRFHSQKNHAFLLQIFQEVARHEPGAWLLLVGDGPLRPAIEQKARDLGLDSRIVFAGVRSDVPRLMMGAMDVFVFPSLYEGLGLVLVEAQAAGLPCVLSDIVPREADIVAPLMHRLSLSDGPARWAEAVLRSRGQTPPSPTECLTLVRESSFNIATAVRRLEDVYAA